MIASLFMSKAFRLTTLVLILSVTGSVFAMGIFGFKICLASEMKGVVTNKGEPVEGASVSRTVHVVGGETYKQSTVTSADGTFGFPGVYDRTLLRKLFPGEVRQNQEVSISFDGASHEGFVVTKQDWEEGGEINDLHLINQGKSDFIPLELTCELTNPVFLRSSRERSGNGFIGKCLIPGENPDELRTEDKK